MERIEFFMNSSSKESVYNVYVDMVRDQMAKAEWAAMIGNQYLDKDLLPSWMQQGQWKAPWKEERLQA